MKSHSNKGCWIVAFFVLGVASFILVSCSDTDREQNVQEPSEVIVLTMVSGDGQQGQAGTILAAPIVVEAATLHGTPAAHIPVEFEVIAGGGSVSSRSVTTDSTGQAATLWKLGPAPVANRLRATSKGSHVMFRAWAYPGEPPELEFVFGAPPGNPSEDLAFHPQRGLFLGTPGGILWAAHPGVAPVQLALSGEAIEAPVGIAFGASGDLYVSDNAGPDQGSVKKITPDGHCTTLSPGPEEQRFSLPNDIAVDSSGFVYVAATCSNAIYRIDPSDGSTDEFLAVPGPNGLAFNSDYSYLYFTTENPALFCGGEDIAGGLYRVAILANSSPGDIEELAPGCAVAGDGLTFDEEGNLYVVLSGVLGSGIKGLRTSGVFVYTPEGQFNKFFDVQMPRNIITNIAFGREPFDPYSLYCYGFTGRLFKVRVGIRGAY